MKSLKNTEIDVINHYDMLINEGNDPFYDTEELKLYMDKWDGEEFIDEMLLDKSKSVLEIGVGTGRIAFRVTPFCGSFCGIDVSPKTVERARENLSEISNVEIICADFLEYEFTTSFDVIYSTLTFMHIEDKEKAIEKVSRLLKMGGRFVLSIDKNPDGYIDFGTRRVKIFPDTPCKIRECIKMANLELTNEYETDMAVVFTAVK